VAARKKQVFSPSSVAGAARTGGARKGRVEAARRALADGLGRTHRLVDRYRALLVQLHDPTVALARPARRLRPSGGSIG
jgi:hypothetical protein